MSNANNASTITTYQTRGVLAGAYRSEAKTLLTHLVFIEGDVDVKVGCRVKLDHIVDECGMPGDEVDARPTCKVCASKWDKLQKR